VTLAHAESNIGATLVCNARYAVFPVL